MRALKAMSWIALSAGGAGCISPVSPAGEAPEPTRQVGQALGNEEEEPNGRFVIGEVLDAAPYSSGTEYFSVWTTGTRGKYVEQVSVIGSASLKSTGLDGTYSGTNPRFNGLALPSADRKYTVIPTILGGDSVTTHYTLDVRDLAGVTTRVCDDAVPLVGTITRSGEHLATPGRITFACKDGSAAKCLRWRYAPGLVAGSAMWGGHQACMQGVNADYCAAGTTSTRVGTLIMFLDDLGVNQVAPGAQIKTIRIADWPPNPVDYYFETAFPAGHQQASCIGKLRWPTITNTCVATLPDCADTTIDGMIAQDDAVMFFGSRYNQLRLERWVRGGDRVTTVSGYHNTDQEKVPWTGFEFQGTDAILLRVPPTSVPPSAVVEVSIFIHRQTQDHVLARSNDARYPASQWDRTFEGYVYTSQLAPHLVPLRTYWNPTTKDLTSSTAEPSVMAGLGYSPVLPAGSELVGWIAPPPP